MGGGWLPRAGSCHNRGMPGQPPLPRAIVELLDDRLRRLVAACREAGVPFHDDAGVADQLQRVLLASDFAWQGFLADPTLLGSDALKLMSDPRPADARAGFLSAPGDAAALRRELRRFRLREALRLIWRDVNGADTLEETLAGATVLAECLLEAALRGAERELAARHGLVHDAAGRPQRMVVFALGKLGGGELNFSSDVDLVFAYAEDGTSRAGEGGGRVRELEAAEWYARLAREFTALLADHDADGYVYRVDTRLRPFGSAGRLAFSFLALEQYFQREGRDWERYAWIKARPVAGDRQAGARFLQTLRPFVYRRYLDYGAFAGLREMKALIDAEVARRDLADHLKLGRGGIREIEFIVQLVQLIRGGREPALREHGLLAALAACERLGCMPNLRARRLGAAYRFLRRLENRLQMLADRQTHVIPEDPALRERIALALGWPDWTGLAAELGRHRAAVAEEFAALMAVEARDHVAVEHGDWTGFWQQAGTGGEIDAAALERAGFVPAARATEELAALLAGGALRRMSARSRSRLDRVMPALLAAAAAAPEPMDSLLRLLRLVQAVARRSVYLALFDEQPAALRRLVGVFSASAFLAEQVIAHPLLIDELLDDRSEGAPPDAQAFAAEFGRRRAALAEDDPEAEIELVQELRQAAAFRIGLAFCAGRLDATAAARALAGIAEGVLGAVLDLALREMQAAHGSLPPVPAGGAAALSAEGSPAAASGMAILAYGSLGGGELGFGSDLDLAFVYAPEHVEAESDGRRPLEGPRWHARLAQRVVHWLGVPTRAGRLYEVDVRLRPDGSQGLLVLSLAAWEAYQRERAWLYELQALVRARPIAGDVALAARLVALRRELLGLPREAQEVLREVAAMRERWRAERDRSDAARFDLKQGAGGLVDIEFLLQALVLGHAARHPALAAGGSSDELIGALAACGIVTGEDAVRLVAAHGKLLGRALGCTLDGRPRVVARDAEVEAEATAVREILARHGLAGS